MEPENIEDVNEEVINDETENDEIDASDDINTGDSDADTDSDSDENLDDPARYTKRIHQKQYELQEARREAEELKQQLAAVNATKVNIAPVIPPLPDPFEDNYDTLMAERDKAIIEASEFDAREKLQQEAKENEAKEELKRQRSKFNEVATSYKGNAKKLGVTDATLTAAGQAVAASGINSQVAGFILQDEKGPLITAHLATNIDTLDKLVAMDPIRAAIFIENTIKPALKTSKRPPAPADTLKGGGVVNKDDGPKGAIYT